MSKKSGSGSTEALAHRLATFRSLRSLTILALGATALTACAPKTPDPRELILEARANVVNAPDSFHLKGVGPEMAWWLVRAGAYDDALATARMVRNQTWFEYEELLRLRAEHGDLHGADSLVEELIPREHVAQVRLELAADAAARGDSLGALQVARRLDARDALTVRLDIVPIFISGNRFDEAESTIVRAQRAGASVDDERARLAQAYYERDDTASGMRMASGVPESEAWDLGLSRIMAAARLSWPRAVSLINARLPIMRSQDYADVAWSMLRRKDTARAVEALDSAGAAALRLPDDLDRLQALANVARTQFQYGLPATAANLMTVPDFAKPHTRRPYFTCQAVSAFATAHRLADVLDVDRRNHCDRTDGAAANFTAGDVDDAIRTLERGGNEGRYAVLVAQWTATAAYTKGLAMALRMFAKLDAHRPANEGQIAYAAAAIVRVMAKTDPAGALKWARARRTPVQQSASLMDLAKVIIAQRDSAAGRPVRMTP